MVHKLFCVSALDFTARLTERDCCTSLGDFVWISVRETLLSKANVTSHVTEPRLMCMYMTHTEGMHLKTKVTVFRCSIDAHQENVAKPLTVSWDLCTG